MDGSLKKRITFVYRLKTVNNVFNITSLAMFFHAAKQYDFSFS